MGAQENIDMPKSPDGGHRARMRWIGPCRGRGLFDNLDLLTPYDALTLGHQGPRSAAGSGTPYVLVPAARSLHFDDIFGVPDHSGMPSVA